MDLPAGDLVLTAFQDRYPLAPAQAGWHRARYCATGMDAGHEVDTPEEGELAPDRYLLQLWPAPPAPDQVVRRGSRAAAYWHAVAQGRAR